MCSQRPSIDVSDLSPDAAAGLLKELPRVVAAVKKASGAPAVKVLSNAGTAAGQVLYLVVSAWCVGHKERDSMCALDSRRVFRPGGGRPGVRRKGDWRRDRGTFQ